MIHPQQHAKGLGRTLTEYRIQHIKAQADLREIVVRTSQFTNAFYAKLGFELQYTKKDFWARGFDLYYMRMPLSKSV